jgi:hypothetical protein
MPDTVFDHASGLLPFLTLDFTPLPLMDPQEAIFWLWGVRTIQVHIDITGDITVFESRTVTVPLGDGTTGSRTHRDQVVDRRGFVEIGDPLSPSDTWTLSFATILYPSSETEWYIGLQYELLSSGLPVLSASNFGASLGNVYVNATAEDRILNRTYERSLQLYTRSGVTLSGTVTITPSVFQDWDDGTGPWIDSSTGALIPRPLI